jgi:hypothetical protein
LKNEMPAKSKLIHNPFAIKVLKAIGEWPPSRSTKNYFENQDSIHLSETARIVLKSFNWAMRIRVPLSGGQPSLVGDIYAPAGWKEVPIDPEVVQELIDARMLHRMTKNDIPLKRAGKDVFSGGRGGWKSAGLDGSKAKFYCAVV